MKTFPEICMKCGQIAVAYIENEEQLREWKIVCTICNNAKATAKRIEEELLNSDLIKKLIQQEIEKYIKKENI